MSRYYNYSDFWMGDDDWDFMDESPTKDVIGDSIDNTISHRDDKTHKMIRLSSARRAIANYVSILTNKNIPVLFNDGNMNCTDGKTVYISADLNKKENFDVAVGLSLHEGSHIKYSDMDTFKTVWMNVPRKIYNLTEPLNISKDYVGQVCKDIYNYVEDRFIDYTVHSSAPGYRGYYDALYDKYFNSKPVTDGLKSQLYRTLSVESYLFRLINLTNSVTDLKALPGLYDIAKILDLRNISRLKTPNDRLSLSFEIAEIVFKYISEFSEESNNYSKKLGDGENEEDSNSGESDSSESNSSESNNGSKESESIEDLIGGTQSQSGNLSDERITNDIGEDDKISETKKNRIRKAYDRQKSFLRGETKKKKVSKKENELLSVLEKSKVEVVNVASDFLESCNIPDQSIECILVKNMTKELLESGDCPMYIGENNKYTYENNNTAVNAGIIMGKKMAHKLQIRNEINVTKFSRRYDGKLDKRLIHELGFNDSNIFYNTMTEKYKNVHFHISIDASSSMSGEKWAKSIRLCTAIAKAATMLDKVDVTISFRTVSNRHPYILIGYNSKVDKFSKIRTLFPYLYPTSTTPEGLCFEALIKYLPESSNDINNYFINMSDGEPYFDVALDNRQHVSYHGAEAAYHTRKQVNKIKKNGYEVISYFISDYHINWSRENFKSMYGADANFINVNNINQIAVTLNKKMMESLDI